MSGSGKGLLGLWLYRSGEQEWAVKEGSPLHKKRDLLVYIDNYMMNKIATKKNSLKKHFLRVHQLKSKEKASSIGQPSSTTMISNDRTSIIFTLNNQVGGLARALQVFQELGINVLHLELQNADSKVQQV